MITAAPDRRVSTDGLRSIADELNARPDVHAEVWFLRAGHPRPPKWPGTRVVDDLRRSLPARLARAAGAESLADRLQGLQLRWWLGQLAPDVIVLDDGLGERVVDRISDGVPRVLRINREASEDLRVEQPFVGRATLALVATDADPGPLDAAETLEVAPDATDRAGTRRYADEHDRRELRRRLNLNEDDLLVVGWGQDLWLDGLDLFIRILWDAQRRIDRTLTGVWFGLDDEPEVEAQVLQEAARCGLDDCIRLMPSGEDVEFCGDVVLLPYRSSLDFDLLGLAAAGLVTVTFPVTSVEDPSVRIADHLDVAGAAELLLGALAEDRAERLERARRRLDVAAVGDAIVRAAHR